MSYNNGSGGQQPFMFGGSQGYSASSTSFGGQGSGSCEWRQHDSVRSCMEWPLSLSANNGSSSGSGEGSGNAWQKRQGSNGGGSFSFSAQPPTSYAQSQQSGNVNYPQPKAFMQLPGNGGAGELHPLRIPCQMGPSGSAMAPMATMEPLTIKMSAPPGAGANGQPISFQIHPSQLMGLQPRRRQ